MARPKKIQTTAISAESPTERAIAPETAMPEVPVEVQYIPPPPPQPRQMRIERQGDIAAPYVRHYPQVRGGVCEFCGVLDPNTPSQYQYKLCPHYRGMSLRCSYCSGDKNPDEINYRSKLEIMDHPDKPGVLIVVCNHTECEKAHQERFVQSVR